MILQSVSDLNNQPARIVSLVPSQTELLQFLGLEEETIAITKFCIHPAKWRISKKIIGGTKNIHVQQVKELHPDLIIANKEENVREQVEELAKVCPVWITNVSNLGDALLMIQDIGALTNTSEKAGELIKNIYAEFSQLPKKREAFPTAYMIWRNPLMTVGGDTFINDMLSRCGLRNIFAEKTRYPVTTLEVLKEAGCGLLLLSSEPYPFTYLHIEELQVFLPDTKILVVNGELFSWYGSRLLQAPGYFRKLITQIDSLFEKI